LQPSGTEAKQRSTTPVGALRAIDFVIDDAGGKQPWGRVLVWGARQELDDGSVLDATGPGISALGGSCGASLSSGVRMKPVPHRPRPPMCDLPTTRAVIDEAMPPIRWLTIMVSDGGFESWCWIGDVTIEPASGLDQCCVPRDEFTCFQIVTRAEWLKG
jgi:hypothetical protein